MNGGLGLCLYFVFLVANFLFSGPAYANLEANETQPTDLIVAVDADFSSAAKEGGEAIARGAQIAIDEINQQGGIYGRMLRLIKNDHRGNPARGIKNIQSLKGMNNLLAVIGGVHTPVALAQLPYIHEQSILYLGAWAAGTSIVENQYSPNFIFRASVRDSSAGNTLIQHAKERGFKSVALVLERTGWGRSNLNSIRNAAVKHGIDIVSETWINWRQTDFEKDMAEILSSKAEAILLVANAPEGAVVIESIPIESPLAVISHWGIAAGKFIDLIGLERLKQLNYDISVLQTFHFDKNRNNPKSQYLLSQYRQRYDKSATHNNVPAQVGLSQAYDLVHLVYLAAMDAIANQNQNAPALQVNELRQALLGLTYYAGAVKEYSPPFKNGVQDALLGDDYFMTHYNEQGFLVPFDEK